MAHKLNQKQVFAFLALALALTLSACSNPSGSSPSGSEPATKPLTETYTAKKGTKTYELTITQSAANARAKAVAKATFTPAEGDSYVLEIAENGVTQTSSGKVNNYSNNKFTLTASNNVTVTFEVTINNSGTITNITGTITVQNGDTLTGPGSLTVTVSSGGGGGGGGGSGGGSTAVTFNGVTANGSGTQTTTQLTLAFNQAITGLSADDITLTGVANVTKGTLSDVSGAIKALSDSGATYTLPIGGFSAGGTLNVAVSKTGYTISGSPKTVNIYFSSGGSGKASGDAQWAKTVSAGGYMSQFNAVACDQSGNVYAAGHQDGSYTYDYGNGATAKVPTSNFHVVLVKYNAGGNAQWVKTVTGGNYSFFNAVACYKSGNVYATGTQYGRGSYEYGNGVTATGTGDENVAFVKYDANGNAQWAKTTSISTGRGYSHFNAIACDQSGNVYAAGYQTGIGTWQYGNGVTATGTYGSGNGNNYGFNVVLVKYDSSGNAQWAKTVSAGTRRSEFLALACDQSGNVYAAGYQDGPGAYEYGNGVTATGTVSGDLAPNVILVKYDPNGNAQWAKTVSSTSSGSQFYAVACDQSGNVYAAGYQNGEGTYGYGNGVSAKAYRNNHNVVLVKYDAGGNALWAKTVSAATSESFFYGVTCDQSGSVYAAGYQGDGTYGYGNSVTAAGVSGGAASKNVVLVKYDAGGNAQWAKTVSVGETESEFNAVTCDQSGNLYAAGYQSGDGRTYGYGNGVTAAGTGSMNVLLVKYRQ